MKKIFIFLTLFSVCSVNLFAQSAITKSDYEIYAEVLRFIRRRDVEDLKTKFSFVILDTAYSNSNLAINYKEKKYRGLNEDFERKNRKPLTFGKIFPVKYAYDLAEISEIDRLLDEGRKEMNESREEKKSNDLRTVSDWNDTPWKFFYKKYPNSKGYFRFSRVGYSLNKRFAVVTIEGKGDSWSSNEEYLFKKVGKKWTFVHAGGGFTVS